MKIGKIQVGEVNGENLKIGIILPYFNEEMGSELMQNTKEELIKNGVKEDDIKVVRVFGALEIPYAAQKLFEQDIQAIISLGVVIEGETSHYDLVTNTCYQGLMSAQLGAGKPIIFGVLTCKTEQQAEERINKDKLNKGAEFAVAAIIQANL